MRLEEAETILGRIRKRYDKRPEGEWRILVGRDGEGRLTQLIADGSQIWQIKGEMVTPLKFAGLGMKLTGMGGHDLLEFGEPYYGLRPIDKDLFMEALRSSSMGALENLLAMPRTSLGKAKRSGPLLEGPIYHSSSPITAISDKQMELEMALNRGLESLMRRKFPETRAAYV